MTVHLVNSCLRIQDIIMSMAEMIRDVETVACLKKREQSKLKRHWRQEVGSGNM